MFKKVTPTAPPYKIAQFPHCDQRVLHAPGECVHCDKYPTWQAIRRAWGIAYTNYTPDEGELPCPATHLRGDKVNRWHGNVASPPEGTGVSG